MAEIQITQDELLIVVSLLSAKDKLYEAYTILEEFDGMLSEGYKGKLTTQIEEYVYCMEKHVVQLMKLYDIGASYIMSAWLEFEEADEATAETIKE